MQHSFDIELAKKYGVEIAILLNNIVFWIKKNQANDKHFYEGRYWTYNSIKAFQELFPYWSFKQMRTILEKLKRCGLILTGNFNENTYDKTTWFSLSDEGLQLFNMKPVDNPQTLCPNGHTPLPNQTSRFAQMGTPYNESDIKPDIKPDFKGSIKNKPKNQKHSFADSMNQMAREQQQIHEHEQLKMNERTKMPDELKKKVGLVVKRIANG